MKIICIGQNYRKHCLELGNKIPTEPVFFLKPDTALHRNNDPFYLPDFSNNLHYELELVVRINRVGKCIEERFAHRYYNEVGLGVDFTARDLQYKQSEAGLPWEVAKAFDHSAAISPEFFPIEKIENIQDLQFRCDLNGQPVQYGATSDMIFTIDRLISYVSKFVTLKIGDLLFTGTPAGVGALKIGDRLEGFLEEQKLIDIEIR
ncbi:MAG: fumarylacetoacetate hydrolase family protein [Rikenellaceae bacterium]|nr:fumarylacetoacetate hydrolase family protein [Rikenellaceae bacterium]